MLKEIGNERTFYTDGVNEYQQVVYCCQQTLYPRGEAPKSVYNVGLTWRPLGTGWKPYCSDDLPPTLDEGKDAVRFTGRERYQARRHAAELAKKWGLPGMTN